MRVLVTGGTGFVGSHSVAALVSQGHQVRLLVRSRDRVASSLSPLGVAEVESVEGDLTAPRSVEEAMAHCDTVLHAAAVFPADPRTAQRVRLVPGRLPFSHEGIWMAALQPHCDESRTIGELGITSRDLLTTLADTVQWLAEQGHLPVRQVLGL